MTIFMHTRGCATAETRPRDEMPLVAGCAKVFAIPYAMRLLNRIATSITVATVLLIDTHALPPAAAKRIRARFARHPSFLCRAIR